LIHVSSSNWNQQDHDDPTLTMFASPSLTTHHGTGWTTGGGGGAAAAAEEDDEDLEVDDAFSSSSSSEGNSDANSDAKPLSTSGGGEADHHHEVTLSNSLSKRVEQRFHHNFEQSVQLVSGNAKSDIRSLVAHFQGSRYVNNNVTAETFQMNESIRRRTFNLRSQCDYISLWFIGSYVPYLKISISSNIDSIHVSQSFAWAYSSRTMFSSSSSILMLDKEEEEQSELSPERRSFFEDDLSGNSTKSGADSAKVSVQTKSSTKVHRPHQNSSKGGGQGRHRSR
jgi:hypothetical protein